VPEYPISNVDSVQVTFVDGTTSDIEDYVVYEDEGIIRLQPESQSTGVIFALHKFPVGFKNIKVVCDVGKDGTDDEPLLEQLETLMAIQCAMTRNVDFDKELTGERLGDYSVDYANAARTAKDWSQSLHNAIARLLMLINNKKPGTTDIQGLGDNIGFNF
jgi:hypothetical protein